ncbi:MAG TPA: VIT domain-containing protein [Xanthomonadales bacterium]|nr:VIT domain-containing protein [Xanthomonadales bacterium]
MMRFAVVLFAFLGCQAAPAQERQVAATQAPVIWLDPALGKLQPIALQDVAIDIGIHGFVASTRMELVFANPNARVLEGELVFPLASGQSITGYALEVEGKLREGVVVPKETARVAYEETVRRGIDPGLAELTKGNVFRTRLYPIPANGTKRVAIAFDQPLLDAGDAWRYVLPLQLAQRVSHFRVHAEVVRTESAPRVADDDALHFERWRDSFVAELEREDFQPTRELAFEVPKSAAPVAAFAVPDALEPAWRTFVAQVASAPSVKLATLPPPRRIVLFYDASGSAATRNRARELDFLAAVLRRAGDATVRLVAFRNDADAPRDFAVRDGDASALRAAIEALPIDGGTSYGAIRFDPSWRADLVLVVGDGMSNFAGAEPALADAPRLAFVHAAQAVDGARFDRLARRHGGEVLNLLEIDADAAVARLAAPRWQLESARVVAGECTDLAPAAPRPVGSSFSLHGRCRGDAEIELRFGAGGGGAGTVRRVKLDAATTLEPARGAFVARLWAVARIAELEDADRPDDAAIAKLAMRHGVVSRNTSMLVLDRIEDYVRYEVEPREPELAAQYRALVAARPKQAPDDGAKSALLADVLRQWREFREYHLTRHPWLETIVQPAAQREAERWSMLDLVGEGEKLAVEAKSLAKQADALQRRWLVEGAQDASRAAWEREAAAVMQRVQFLHDRRLAIAPESDEAPADVEEDVVAREEVVTAAAEAPVVVDRASQVAEGAPPPPRPALAAAPAGASTSDTMRMMRADEAEKTIVAGKDAEVAVAEPERKAQIELGAWNPDTPYLPKLRAAADPYVAYLRERAAYGKTPAFFLDCADYFRNEAKDDRLALRVLSNLAEIDLESAPLVRVLAYRLQQWDRFELAVPLFEEALVLRGEEPQSRRDLALALSRQPAADYERAVALLWEVVSRPWDSRFPGVQLIALHELGDVLARAPAGARGRLDALTAKLGIAPELLEPLAVDLRVVLTWDADNTDIDLWVIDPTGDTAIYSQPRTKTGGHMSSDFTGGYGPEVFTIRRALPGTYVVKAHYFGDRQQKLTGAVTVQAEFLTDFDSGTSKRAAVTRRLEGDEDVIEIGRFTVDLD